MPTKLTAQWFEPNEYDIANSLASLAQPLGTMMTFLLAPFIAKEPSDLSYLLSYFAIPVFLSFIGSLFVRQEGYNIKVSEQSFKELVVVLIEPLRHIFFTLEKKPLTVTPSRLTISLSSYYFSANS